MLEMDIVRLTFFSKVDSRFCPNNIKKIHFRVVTFNNMDHGSSTLTTIHWRNGFRIENSSIFLASQPTYLIQGSSTCSLWVIFNNQLLECILNFQEMSSSRIAFRRLGINTDSQVVGKLLRLVGISFAHDTWTSTREDVKVLFVFLFDFQENFNFSRYIPHRRQSISWLDLTCSSLLWRMAICRLRDRMNMDPFPIIHILAIPAPSKALSRNSHHYLLSLIHHSILCCVILQIINIMFFSQKCINLSFLRTL